MSLLSPERYRLGLGASYAVLAEVKAGMLANWRMQTWPASAGTSWQEPLAAAAAWLHDFAPKRAKVGVVLSSELAPLQLLPWREDASRADQQALIAANLFRSIHGETAAHNEVCLFPTGYGHPWLASAISSQLLAALTEQLRDIGLRVTSITPLPVSMFNTLVRRPHEPAGWLLVSEPQHLTALHWRAAQWSLLRTLPSQSLQNESLADLLQRETRLAGLTDMPAKIYLTQPLTALVTSDCIKFDSGWKSHASVPQDSPIHLLGGRA